jgi:hypothetical protein
MQDVAACRTPHGPGSDLGEVPDAGRDRDSAGGDGGEGVVIEYDDWDTANPMWPFVIDTSEPDIGRFI